MENDIIKPIVRTDSAPVRAKRRLPMIIIILAAFSIGLSLYARWTPLFPGDLDFITFMQSISNTPLTWLMAGISWIFGDWHAALLVVPAGALIWFFLGRPPSLLVFAAALISLLNDAFKLAVNRPRPSPEQVHIIGINHGNGFPSGHAFFATIFLGVLAYLLFTYLKKNSLRVFSLAVLILLALLVGTSRIYLGAHWPSDVLGGYIVGGLFLAVLIRTYKYVHNS